MVKVEDSDIMIMSESLPMGCRFESAMKWVEAAIGSFKQDVSGSIQEIAGANNQGQSIHLKNNNKKERKSKPHDTLLMMVTVKL